MLLLYFGNKGATRINFVCPIRLIAIGTPLPLPFRHEFMRAGLSSATRNADHLLCNLDTKAIALASKVLS
jgi:hypothetical protein